LDASHWIALGLPLTSCVVFSNAQRVFLGLVEVILSPLPLYRFLNNNSGSAVGDYRDFSLSLFPVPVICLARLPRHHIDVV
jgi:hypothetical protein